jgi:putative acetyltransferase
MLIRRETATDETAVAAVTEAAFRTPENDPPVEVGLLAALRTDAGWLPRLSLVAVIDEVVIGHVVCSRGSLGGLPALGLGPLSVLPLHQRKGVGSALMHAVLAAADALDESVVVLLGDPAYYSRFGFRLADELGITPDDPAWVPYFQARTLTTYHPPLRGAFTYATPFQGV